MVKFGLPIYKDVNKQLRFTLDASGVYKYWQFPKNTLPGFQFQRNARPQSNVTVRLIDLAGGDTLLANANLISKGAKDIILFKPRQTTIECGSFYYEISDGVETWYSEVFTITNKIIPIFTDINIIDGLYVLVSI
jgi:hypothetical protein